MRAEAWITIVRYQFHAQFSPASCIFISLVNYAQCVRRSSSHSKNSLLCDSLMIKCNYTESSVKWHLSYSFFYCVLRKLYHLRFWLSCSFFFRILSCCSQCFTGTVLLLLFVTAFYMLWINPMGWDLFLVSGASGSFQLRGRPQPCWLDVALINFQLMPSNGINISGVT